MFKILVKEGDRREEKGNKKWCWSIIKTVRFKRRTLKTRKQRKERKLKW